MVNQWPCCLHERDHNAVSSTLLSFGMVWPQVTPKVFGNVSSLSPIQQGVH